MIVRDATRGDFSLLVSLTAAEGWNYTLEDFYWMEGAGGKSLVALHDGEIVGMATMFDYGEVGWISNLLVKHEDRGQGFGSAILAECLKRFSNKRTVALFSYQHSVGFYEELGFRSELDAHIVALEGGAWEAKGRAEGRFGDWACELDRRCFGYDRPQVLMGLARKGSFIMPKRGLGFAIARKDPVEPTAGPVIAQDLESGRELLMAALASAGPNATALVLERGLNGLRYMGSVRRLYLGEPPKIDRKMAVAFAGLELG